MGEISGHVNQRQVSGHEQQILVDFTTFLDVQTLLKGSVHLRTYFNHHQITNFLQNSANTDMELMKPRLALFVSTECV